MTEFFCEAPTIGDVDELNDLYRENTRRAEEEFKALTEEPSDVTKNLKILRALRTASEDAVPRASQPPNPRTQKRSGRPEVDAAIESPGPSPSVVVPSSRVKENNSVRSGSVPLAK